MTIKVQFSSQKNQIDSLDYFLYKRSCNDKCILGNVADSEADNLLELLLISKAYII